MELEFYKALTIFPSQRHRWKLIAYNNRVVAASSEGFSSEAGARQNAHLTLEGLRLVLEPPKRDER